MRSPDGPTLSSDTKLSSDIKLSPELSGAGLQVAAMIHEENAKLLADSLRKMNFPVLVVKRPGGRLYQVVVGPYSTVDATIAAKNDLEKKGFQPIRTEWKGVIAVD